MTIQTLATTATIENEAFPKGLKVQCDISYPEEIVGDFLHCTVKSTEDISNALPQIEIHFSAYGKPSLELIFTREQQHEMVRTFIGRSADGTTSGKNTANVLSAWLEQEQKKPATFSSLQQIVLQAIAKDDSILAGFSQSPLRKARQATCSNGWNEALGLE